jgi:hypothetical protein
MGCGIFGPGALRLLPFTLAMHRGMRNKRDQKNPLLNPGGSILRKKIRTKKRGVKGDVTKKIF